MSAPPVFRTLGSKVKHVVPLMNTGGMKIKEIIFVFNNKTYGLEPDSKATYNNPVTEEPTRAKEPPIVKEMKGQLIESLETLTLSPTATKSPITSLPKLPTTVGLPTTVASPGRKILEIPSPTTKITPVQEQTSVILVPTAGSVRAAPATTLARPTTLDIDPSKIGTGKGGGKLYNVTQLKAILKQLGLSTRGNKPVLVNTLVNYIKDVRNTDPTLYERLPAEYK